MEALLTSKNGIAWSATVAAGTANSLTLRSQVDVLKEGSLTAFQDDGTRIVATGSFTKTENHGYFLLGMPSGVATKKSPRINFDTLSYTKNAYTAAVAQTGILGDDGFAALTSGAFGAGHVGMELICTVVSSSGDFRAGSTALLRTVSTGVDLTADTELVLGAKYLVIAAGTPDAWGGATLASSLTGTLTIGTKAVGASYGVRIVDLSKETWERRNWEVSLALTSASTTDAAMLAALVTAFNAHPEASAIATASVTTSDAGIKFVGVNAGENFSVQGMGLLYGTTFTSNGAGVTDKAISGQGTNAQILKLEYACSGIEGRTGSNAGSDERGDIFTVPSMVESGQNYVVYVLEWTDDRTVAYPSNNSNPMTKRLNIAVPSGDSTMITAVDNVLGDLV